jgi:hypothetical protein
MKILDSLEIQAKSIEGLGLDPLACDFSSTEALAALIRRTASFCCPCSAGLLAKTVVNLLRPLLDNEGLFERVQDAIEGVQAYGDLIEVPANDERQSRSALDLAAPAVITISYSRLLIVGVAPGGNDPLPESLASLVEFRGFARLIRLDDIQLPVSDLLNAGFLVVSSEEWGQLPRNTSADELVERYEKLLRQGNRPGELDGLRLLIPDSNVRFYRGRWSAAKTQSGMFVARRERRFGADSWCVVRLTNGIPDLLVDLPTKGAETRGCDEAWHLQQAIDARNGTPQEYRVRQLRDRESVALDFFSPIPRWAARQWDILGEQIDTKGALISYLFPASVEAEEIKFAETRMWLKRQ